MDKLVDGENETNDDRHMLPLLPSLPYKVDTSRPSVRTNWTRLVHPSVLTGHAGSFIQCADRDAPRLYFATADVDAAALREAAGREADGADDGGKGEQQAGEEAAAGEALEGDEGPAEKAADAGKDEKPGKQSRRIKARPAPGAPAPPATLPPRDRLRGRLRDWPRARAGGRRGGVCGGRGGWAAHDARGGGCGAAQGERVV